MSAVWQTVFAIIGSVGGAGVIIAAVVKFSSDKIAERLSAKYQLKLDKELEAFKGRLDRKNYVSRVRFDAEFAIYRELSQVFSEAIEGVHGIIPTDAAYYPKDEQEKQDYINHLFIQFAKSSYAAQRTLFANAPFISKELYDKFDEILDLIRTQSEVYNEATFATTLSNAEGLITDEDSKRTASIDEKFAQLTSKIRMYLSDLEIIGGE